MASETLLTAAHRLKRKESRRKTYLKHREAQRVRNRLWAKNNPEKVTAHAKAYRAKNPDYFKNKHLLAKYGITLVQRDEILRLQGNVCAICGRASPGRKNNRGADGDWIVEHCHSTGSIRGIVCHPCNVALAMVGENPKLLRDMAEYIERSLKP